MILIFWREHVTRRGRFGGNMVTQPSLAFDRLRSLSPLARAPLAARRPPPAAGHHDHGHASPRILIISTSATYSGISLFNIATAIMLSAQEIILQYVCPLLGCVVANVMFAGACRCVDNMGSPLVRLFFPNLNLIT